MLRVYVDNQTVPTPPATCTTLRALVAWVTREHLHDGRIVQKLLVDGQNCFTLSPESLELFMTDPGQIRRIAMVEMTSTPAATLAHESIVGAIDYCDSLLFGLQNIAQKLRSGQFQEGLHFYTAAVRGIISLMELLSYLEQILTTDYSRKIVHGASVRASLDGIAPLIDALVSAQERNDLITMADFLEYDIHDTIGQWKLILHDLANVAPTDASEDSRTEPRNLASPSGVPAPVIAPISTL